MRNDHEQRYGKQDNSDLFGPKYTPDSEIGKESERGKQAARDGKELQGDESSTFIDGWAVENGSMRMREFGQRMSGYAHNFVEKKN